MKTENEILNAIQDNDEKNDVRKAIVKVVKKVLPKMKTKKIVLATLPSTEWPFEKGIEDFQGFNGFCKENGVACKIVGIENSSEKITQEAFRNNAPSNAKCIKGNYDEVVRNLPNVNFYYPDYCGHPAKKKAHCTSYSYPEINAFVRIAEEKHNPFLYFMTFRCNISRFKGGRDKLMRTMCKNAKTMPIAIRSKISQTLSIHGLQDKVKLIFSYYYHGTGSSLMLTIGYAVNMNITMKAVKIDTIKNRDMTKVYKTKSASNASNVEIDPEVLIKKAMKCLYDHKWDKKDIATVFNTKLNKVSSVMSWHDHRSSWTKAWDDNCFVDKK